MQNDKLPKLTHTEIQWLEQSKALREEATVDQLVDSFIVLFPDRAKHDALSIQEIKKTLKSRFQDILYRQESKARVEKIRAQTPHVTEAFSVLNPQKQLEHYESVFTDPDATASEKSKAINDAEKLHQRRLPEKAHQKKDEKKMPDAAVISLFRIGFEMIYDTKRFHQYYQTLSPEDQKEINPEDGLLRYTELKTVFLRLGRGEELEKQKPSGVDFHRMVGSLSDAAVVEIHHFLRDGNPKNEDVMSADQIAALIEAHLDA